MIGTQLEIKIVFGDIKSKDSISSEQLTKLKSFSTKTL